MPRMGAEMSIEAMKQALDALDSDNPDIQLRAAIALRQSIEQAEKQEPVAWVQDVEFEQLPEFAFSWVKTRLHDKPLYTHPSKREPLTDEEARALWPVVTLVATKDIMKFVRAIEEAHGIKEEA